MSLRLARPLAVACFFMLTNGCAATPTASDEPAAAATAQSAIIGSLNAKFVSVDGDVLRTNASYDWQASWTHVVSLRASDNTPLLFLYARDLGEAKVLRYSSAGGWTTLASYDDFQRDWDAVIPARGSSGGANLVFYRRADGLVKAIDVRSDGSWTSRFTQNIDSPSGFDRGWDLVVSSRMSASGELVFYHRMAGLAAFARYDAAKGKFVVRNTQPWKHTWDEVDTGDFDGDGVDDVVLHNQDDGTLKTVLYDASFAIKAGGEKILANVGTAHGARLAVADFGGGARKDIALYQTDGGQTFENGKLLVWTDDPATGALKKTTTNLDVADGWTHLVPIDAGAKKGLLFYSNQHVIDVAIHPMVEETSALTAFPWKAGDPARLKRLADAMRKTFAPAGLAFNVRFGTMGKNDVLAGWVCSTGADRSAANAWINANLNPRTLPITLATTTTSWTGCSNLAVKFVRSRYSLSAEPSGLFDSTDYEFATEKHFAHEVGHYFGLPHAHLEDLDTVADVEAKLQATAWELDALDTDAHVKEADGEVLSVYDTPPALGAAYWKNTYGGANFKAKMCAEGAVEKFTSDSNSVSVTVEPYNVMSYNQCAGSDPNQVVARLTRDQIRVVRQTLYTTRAALIGRSPAR